MMQLRAPKFWWRRGSLAGYVLSPFGSIYGSITSRRMSQPGVSVDVPVICVGNVVLGGAGKTPTAIEVAKVCHNLGLRPGFLSRGYRGSEIGPIIVIPALHTVRDVGDEAVLLARHAPTVVSVDRPSGAKLLAGIGVDVVIMDDGLQNPSLEKDLAIVVIDGERGVGNGLVFPAGPLRGPVAPQIRRADALVVLGPGPGGSAVRIAGRAGLSVLRAHTVSVRRRGLKRRPYLAFAGIAEPRKFYASLAAAGGVIGFTMDFPDHHLFSDADCELILAEARRRDLVPITTEKDRVRLYGRAGPAERLANATETFPVRVRFDEPKRLEVLISDAVAHHAGVYRRSGLTSAGAILVPA
jgi:tetraacyldisaccharide 4'-kinase